MIYTSTTTIEGTTPVTAPHFNIVAAYTTDPTNLDLVDAAPDAAQRADLGEAQRLLEARSALLEMLEAVVAGHQIDLDAAASLLIHIRGGA